jgi:hypothetical protein
VIGLLRTNLAGADEESLNRAAVQGLLKELEGRASLVGEPTGSPASAPLPGIVQTAVYDGTFGYVRLGRMIPGLDAEVMAAWKKMSSTNRMKGLVLDLRLARGDDYAAATALADIFLNADAPVMDWGQGMQRAAAKTNVFAFPLALLINRETAGAAEALAAALRLNDVGLLLGSPTAGQASMMSEFVLSNGQRLRIATTPIKIANGQTVAATGLKPDIAVAVTAADERAWIEDSYRDLSKGPLAAVEPTPEPGGTGTNRAPRRRINEAELVRMLREGQNPDAEPTNAPGAREVDSGKPLVRDPVLARALDLLKGLAVMHQFRSI